MRTPYDKGWAKAALPRSKQNEHLPPDRPPTVDYENYPSVFIPPFHYSNPVTGDKKPMTGADLKELSEEGLAPLLDDLERRTGLLQDADEVERLQAVYGYYLAGNQWDDLTGIFAPDGTIEIAQRGVYKDHKGIRRNLNLYGEQDQLRANCTTICSISR
jgi:hypothetical protein